MLLLFPKYAVYGEGDKEFFYLAFTIFSGVRADLTVFVKMKQLSHKNISNIEGEMVCVVEVLLVQHV